MADIKRTKGFTLIELVIVLTIVGIIAAMAVPSFTTVIANNRLAATSNDLIGLLNYARAEAVKQGVVVRVAPVDNSNNWNNGVAAFIDANGDNNYQASEGLRLMDAAPGAVTVTVTFDAASPSNLVGFTGAGFSGSIPTFSVCDDRTGESGRQATITLGGRIRAEALVCG